MAEVTRSADIREVQQWVTDLAQRDADADVNSEMTVSFCQQLADRTRFVVAGDICMASLNTEEVFEDVSDRLNVGIPQVILSLNVMGTFINEEAYRKFERNSPLGTLFLEGERPSSFQVTAAQRN